MVSTVRSALLTTEMDERQMAMLLTGACLGNSLTALGVAIGAVAHAVLSDRRTLRSWLTISGKAAA